MTVTPAPASEARVPVLSAWWVLIAGVVGLVASMALTIEKFKLLLNPSYVPSCNINPIVSCGSVMTTPQASVLGFPNPLLGIIGFTVVVVTGVLSPRSNTGRNTMDTSTTSSGMVTAQTTMQ